MGGGIEDSIFSSDYIWQVYLACKNLEKYTAQYLANRHIGDSQFYDLIENINKDCTFYEKKNQIIRYADLQQFFGDEKHDIKQKSDFLSDYLISIWIQNSKKDKFYVHFVEYIQGNRECIEKMKEELSEYEFDDFWIERVLSTAEYQLHELGFFGKNNKFRDISLFDLIMKGSKDGSYNVVTLAASYLKLSNYEKREININDLAYCWTMYFEHKDYSVYTIDEALNIFEKQKLIHEDESFMIIQKLMAQSDDGISHLMTSYVNKKGVEFIEKINEKGYFSEKDCRIRFWELNPEIYNCFGKEDMANQITELLSIHYYSKCIDGRDIQNVMKTKYKNMLLDGLEYYEYSVLSP